MFNKRKAKVLIPNPQNIEIIECLKKINTSLLKIDERLSDISENIAGIGFDNGWGSFDCSSPLGILQELSNQTECVNRTLFEINDSIRNNSLCSCIGKQVDKQIK